MNGVHCYICSWFDAANKHVIQFIPNCVPELLLQPRLLRFSMQDTFFNIQSSLARYITVMHKARYWYLLYNNLSIINWDTLSFHRLVSAGQRGSSPTPNPTGNPTPEIPGIQKAVWLLCLLRQGRGSEPEGLDWGHQEPVSQGFQGSQLTLRKLSSGICHYWSPWIYSTNCRKLRLKKPPKHHTTASVKLLFQLFFLFKQLL